MIEIELFTCLSVLLKIYFPLHVNSSLMPATAKSGLNILVK